MLNKLNKKGFTLIELLVVVLIIGILAAIAIPKYQLAVEKTRATERLAIATTIYAAQQRYKLGTGSWADNMEDLDVTVPSTNQSKKNLTILINNARNEVEVKHVVTSGTAPYYRIFIQMEDFGYIPFPKGSITCAVQSQGGNDLARKVCDNLCGPTAYYETVAGEQRCLINYANNRSKGLSEE